MERKGTFVSAAALAASASAGSAGAAEADFESAVRAAASYKFGDGREPLTALEDIVKASKRSRARLAALERRFAELLGSPDATWEAKDFVCRQLWIIGTKASVPALAALLADETYSDMARYALERNPAPEAGNALRDALPNAAGKARIGIVNSLGARRDKKSIAALENIAAGTDEEAAAAAVSALGKIGGDTASRIVSRVLETGAPKARKAAELAQRVMNGKPAPRTKK